MKLFLINPNSTASMTSKIGAGASAVAAPGTVVVARNPANGPAAIEGPADGEAALPGLFAEIDRAVDEGADAVVIACFDDTGLDEARARAPVPVIGIGEAAYRVASLLGPRFSVVTTLAVSIPVLKSNIAAYGLGKICARMRAAGVPVLALEEPDGAATERVAEEIRVALAEDGVGVIVLGCAGMTALADGFTRRFGVPVIDGVAAAVRLAEVAAAFRGPRSAAFRAGRTSCDPARVSTSGNGHDGARRSRSA